MSDEVLHRLDQLITLSERIANVVEGLDGAIRDIHADVSSMQTDISRIDEYAYSIKLDVNSIMLSMS